MAEVSDLHKEDYFVYYDSKSLSSPPISVWSRFPYLLESKDISEYWQNKFHEYGLKFIIFEAILIGDKSYFAFMNEIDYNVAVLLS